MASVNKVIVIGNAGKDPEMRYLPSGEAVANLAVATTDAWKDKATGEKKELTEWHRISFFGKLAEIVGQYVKKGSQVYVEGSLRTRKWTDKEGIERYTTEIKADTMKMLGARPAGNDDQRESNQQSRPAQQPQRQQAPQQSQQRGAPPANFSDFPDDDIPFGGTVLDIRDAMGQSKSHLRAKYGRGLSLKHVNQGEF